MSDLFERERWRATLPPHPEEGVRFRGLRPWVPDPRDYLISHLPGIPRAIEAGLPDTVDLRPWDWRIEDQDGLGACVAAAFSGMESMYKFHEHGVKIAFDWRKFYSDNGGSGNSGLDARAAMQFAQDKGIPELGTSRRFRVGSYAVAYGGPAWVDTLKGALAAGHIVCLALLLPSSFGWTSNATLTSGYHEVVLAGYGTDPQLGPYWLIKNSWSAGWGLNGYGRVSISFTTLNNNQQGYAFALTTVDYLDDGLGPPPPPPPALHLLSASARDAAGNVTTTGVITG